MTEHGLIFSGAMVRAIRADLKTQTRRIATPHNSLVDGRGVREWPEGALWSKAWVDPGPSPAGNDGPYWRLPASGGVPHRVYPRVQPDGRLWVKEAFCTFTALDINKLYPAHLIRYKADGAFNKGNDFAAHNYWKDGRTRSPVFMLRQHSRFLLEVVEVRPQFLQEISEADAKAEGVAMPDGIKEPPDWWSYRHEFALVWNMLHGKPKPRHGRVDGKRVITHYESHPWQDITETREHRGKPWYVRGNPPVWVYTFKRQEGQ